IWPMFGIANQLLAVVALCVVTAVLINEGRARYAWISVLPLAFVISTTSTAGVQLIRRFLGEAGSKPAEAFRWNLNAALTAIMLALVALILVVSARSWWRGLRRPRPGGAP
ncbi:MAG: carbon starvation protein A, partial [Planctomycetes bacterium]|nr:carbon starvation protein A [Planctomycetota bacterium]